MKLPYPIDFAGRLFLQSKAALTTSFEPRADSGEEVAAFWDGCDYHAQMEWRLVLYSNWRLKVIPVGQYRDELAGVIEGEIRPGERVLEAGCGDGINLARINYPVDGFDLSPERASRAQTHTEGITFTADIRSIPVEDKAYDLIYSCHCLEQVPPSTIGAALAEMRRVAKRVVLVEPIHELQNYFGRVYQRRAGYGAQSILSEAKNFGDVQKLARLGMGNPFNQSCILELV